ncbi:hypothetical protein SAMN06269173_101258 [Hymenobacter mucosus]|uniref:Uncharacterized protein n=1 Tax=Hymenobacter mucosus TaxID=1411120 RepID=A0A238V802_9BACT|nr:hypothetical protein SAMN06269173_101258 [Hymenobacter mucosus]
MTSGARRYLVIVIQLVVGHLLPSTEANLRPFSIQE